MADRTRIDMIDHDFDFASSGKHAINKQRREFARKILVAAFSVPMFMQTAHANALVIWALRILGITVRSKRGAQLAARSIGRKTSNYVNINRTSISIPAVSASLGTVSLLAVSEPALANINDFKPNVVLTRPQSVSDIENKFYYQTDNEASAPFQATMWVELVNGRGKMVARTESRTEIIKPKLRLHPQLIDISEVGNFYAVPRITTYDKGVSIKQPEIQKVSILDEEEVVYGE